MEGCYCNPTCLPPLLFSLLALFCSHDCMVYEHFSSHVGVMVRRPYALHIYLCLIHVVIGQCEGIVFALAPSLLLIINFSLILIHHYPSSPFFHIWLIGLWEPHGFFLFRPCSYGSMCSNLQRSHMLTHPLDMILMLSPITCLFHIPVLNCCDMYQLMPLIGPPTNTKFLTSTLLKLSSKNNSKWYGDRHTRAILYKFFKSF